MTPQGKHRAADGAKKNKSLKRVGSPTLSESSGNESSRKKLKKVATPAMGSRSGTPIPGAMKQKYRKGAGSGSDGEGTGGEMSDGAGARKKLKLGAGSVGGTPTASRAGSPTLLASKSPRASFTRILVGRATVTSQSVQKKHADNFTGVSPVGQFGGATIDPAEILEKIPPEGITSSELIKKFSGRIGDRPGMMNKQDWIKLVKEQCDRAPDGRLHRKHVQ